MGQETSDTLSRVKLLSQQGDLNKSLDLIRLYHEDHGEDMYTNWIYGQVAYQAHKFKLSATMYEKALSLSPEEKGLRLDYAKTLVNGGELDRAEKELTVCTEKDPANPEPWLYLARIFYWRGEYTTSLAYLDNLILNVPDYLPAKNLRDQVRHDMSPWLSLELPYSSDDQPLKMISPSIVGGINRSNLLGMDFRVTAPLSLKDSSDFTSVGVSIGNKFHFNKPKLSIYLNLGLFNHTSLNSWGWTGELKVEKQLFKKLVLWADVKRSPYLYTLGSLQLPLFENHLTLAATWNDPDRWNGQVNFEESTFSSDDNLVTAFCGWIFAPAVKTGRFDFHFGYGYNYSNSRKNTFASTKTVDEVLATWDQDSTINGAYDPYFTPNDQQIHSLLATVNFKAAKKLSFFLNLNVGVYATTMYPYLFLNETDSDSLFIDKSYVKERFNPFNGTLGLNWNILKDLDLKATFNYNSTIYYKTRTFGITISKRF
jgi:hypothetical protein